MKGWGVGAFLIAGALCARMAVPAIAQDTKLKRTVPDWMTFDVEKRKVSLYVVAGLTTANSGWNFNGYANGDMTIVVPLGWTVEIRFTSRDANYPHSVGIVEIEDEMPASGDQAKIAFPRAFSLQFSRGFFGPREDKFDFKVDRAGRFWMLCGVPPHARGGMWDYFVVSEEAEEPYVELPQEKP